MTFGTAVCATETAIGHRSVSAMSNAVKGNKSRLNLGVLLLLLLLLLLKVRSINSCGFACVCIICQQPMMRVRREVLPQ